MPHANTLDHPAATVLCIDDLSDVLQLEKAILEDAGYEVLLASNGADGLNLVSDNKVDVVILDCEMPQITGTELAHRIRAMHPRLPIIMVSGAEQPKETIGIVESFLPKAQMPATLVAEVKRLTWHWPISFMLLNEFC